MKIAPILVALATVVSSKAVAATPNALQVNLELEVGDDDREALKTSIIVPIGETATVGGMSGSTSDAINTLRNETQIKVTPNMTPEGSAKIALAVVRDAKVLSSANLIVELGQAAEVISSSDDGKTVKVKVTATRPKLIPIGRYDLIDKIEHGVATPD